MNKSIEFIKDKCISCSKCRQVCPFNVIEYIEGKPRLNPDKVCLKCMHCAIICPVGAVQYNGENAVLERDVPELTEEFPELLEVHLMKRRSYRHFKTQPVDRECLEHALQIASWAPSAKNEHPTKYIIVDNKQTIDKIMKIILEFAEKNHELDLIVKEYQEGNNPVMGNAPTLLLAYAPANAINPIVDSTLKLYTAELILQAKGIGSCWAGYLTRLSNSIPELKELFDLPEGNTFVAALMLGYPDYNVEHYDAVPERIKKQDIRWL